MREAIKIYNSTVSFSENSPSFSATVSHKQQNKQENQQLNSSPGPIATNSQSSLGNKSSNEQHLTQNKIQTHSITPTTTTSELSTQFSDPNLHALTTHQLEQSYHSIMQLQQTHYQTTNNTISDSNSNSPTDFSFDLPHTSSTNKIISHSNKISLTHADDSIMSEDDELMTHFHKALNKQIV